VADSRNWRASTLQKRPPNGLAKRVIVLVLGIGFVYVSAAYAQPILNGNYGSEGSGTINGEPVTEIAHWVFSQNKLVGFSQTINWGGKLTSSAGQPENSDGEGPGFCEMSVSGGPTTSQLNGELSVNLEMSTPGCPYPHNGSGQPQLKTAGMYSLIQKRVTRAVIVQCPTALGCRFQLQDME
jgi:hypothetical protein